VAQTIGRRALIEDVTWVISQGATNSFALQWNVGTDAEPELYDFTGHQARCQARRKPGAEPWFTLTEGEGLDGRIWIDGTQLTVELYPEASTEWRQANKAGQWDLEIASPDGEVTRLAMGPVEVSLEITATEEV